MYYVDHAIFLVLVLATAVILMCVFHFMYLDAGIGMRSGTLHAQVYG